MFTFKYPTVDLKDFTQAFAVQMGTRVINNRFLVPSDIGDGYVQQADMINGISAFIMNFTLHTDMHFEQSKSVEELYSLRFEESFVKEALITQIDSEYHKDSRAVHNSAYLVCNYFDLGYFFSKGSHVKCVTLQLTKEWLAKYLQMEVYDEIVQQYVSLKTASLHIEPLDAEYKRLLVDIIDSNQSHPSHVAALENRMMSLIERFFNNLYEKRYQYKYQVRASTFDIEQIRLVEQAVTEDVSEPCPSINDLSKMVSMSPSKLKQLFRDVFGKPIYQYYQFHRMQKAKAMLLSRKFSVKQVGISVGYASLSNFSAAFRKEFKVLPSELSGN
ncbi:MAG: AraC family transcriptional regulator [Chitinophagaceae bacterium]